MKRFALYLFSMITGFACAKESTPPSVVGYWRGAFGAGMEITILQREDGTGRLYAFPATILGRDTAQDAIKIDGTWQLKNGNYVASYSSSEHGVTYDMNAVVDSPTITINGFMTSHSSMGVVGTTFTIIKQ